MQGEKSGDFFSDFLKKYYSNLALKIANILIDKSEKKMKCWTNPFISRV